MLSLVSISVVKGLNCHACIHSLTAGVPRQPTIPQVTGWSHDHAIVSTIVHKVGSTQNFSITMILLVNVTTEVSRHVVLVEGYEGGDGIELVFPNVSYEHEWRFQVFASNYLGNSEYSLMSAAGVCVCVHVHACVFVCVHACVYVHVCVLVYACACLCVCTCVCVCVCVCDSYCSHQHCSTIIVIHVITLL